MSRDTRVEVRLGRVTIPRAYLNRLLAAAIGTVSEREREFVDKLSARLAREDRKEDRENDRRYRAWQKEQDRIDSRVIR